jgi:hypothetical protein
LSIHEEVTYATDVPMMGVFNNLVIYKQDEPKNSVQSIVPDLARSWSWSCLHHYSAPILRRAARFCSCDRRH